MLSTKKHYLQVALNSTIHQARQIILQLPPSDRILIEAGTPLIKNYGSEAIEIIRDAWLEQIRNAGMNFDPYVIADLKCMDRGATEAQIAASNGASAAVALGLAPIETLNAFIAACDTSHIDSMIDMMNVDKPYKILRKLNILPQVVILHRGVDEERDGNALFPIQMINKIKGAFNVMISIAGGDTPREIQSAIFNSADIVVVWKDFYQSSYETAKLANDFLKGIK